MTSTFRLLTRQCCIADSPARFAIDAGACTRVGSQRQNNEDSYSVNAEDHIFVVADGIGGASAGERASRMAADLLPRRLSPIGSAPDASEEDVIEMIRTAFDETNAAILRAGRQYDQFYKMGTTSVMALIIGSRLYVASIGDSRAYLVRCGRVELLTVDHTMAQALVEAGVISRNEALRHRWRNVLSKYLGHAQADNNEPDVRVVDVQGGDQIVLSTDGLTNVVDEREMLRILQENFGAQDAANELIEVAGQRNARDDATCVVLLVSEVEGPHEVVEQWQGANI